MRAGSPSKVLLSGSGDALDRRPLSGTPRQQLGSRFLVCTKGDSVEGICGALTGCAEVSKTAHGVGLSIRCIRAAGCVFFSDDLAYCQKPTLRLAAAASSIGAVQRRTGE